MEKVSRLEEMLTATSSKMKAREQRVMEYLLENEDSLQTLSISQIAKESGASKATVVRFCKSLGFQGLKDFRVWYEAGKGSMFTSLSEVTEESSSEEIADVLKNGISKMVDSSLSPEACDFLETLLPEIRNASSITVVGEGENAPYAGVLGDALNRTASEKVAVLTTKEELGGAESSALCFILSFSGSDKAAMGYLSSVVLDGGKVFSFTAEAGSLICKSSTQSCTLSNEAIFRGDKYLLAKSSLLSILSFLIVLLERA